MGQHGLPTRPVNTGIQNDTRVYGRVDGPCIEPKVTGASSYVVPRPNHNRWKAIPLHSWFVFNHTQIQHSSIFRLLMLNWRCLWPPYVIGGHYIFALYFLSSFFFLLSSFFPRLISAAVDWMSAILLHMVWP